MTALRNVLVLAMFGVGVAAMAAPARATNNKPPAPGIIGAPVNRNTGVIGGPKPLHGIGGAKFTEGFKPHPVQTSFKPSGGPGFKPSVQNGLKPSGGPGFKAPVQAAFKPPGQTGSKPQPIHTDFKLPPDQGGIDPARTQKGDKPEPDRKDSPHKRH